MRLKYKEAAKKDRDRYEKELKVLEKNSGNGLKKPKKCLSAYMIFVKETRPKIVEANPTMGALNVMKEVGLAWQNMNDKDREYFKEKADTDKIRYLKEQRAFYDEVERIGTVTSANKSEEPDQDKEGHSQLLITMKTAINETYRPQLTPNPEQNRR